MGEHAPVVAQHLAEVEGLLVLRLQGLLNFPLHHQADEQADAHQQPEDHSPVAMGTDVAAHHGRHQWGERHHQDHEGHGAGEGLLLEQVAQQRIDHHRAGRPAGRLQHPVGQELRQGVRHGAAHRGDGKHHQPRQDHRLAAIAVGERAIEQLADGKAAEEGADGELGAIDAGGQIPGNGRNGGQVHVDRERRQACQGAEQDEQETGGEGGVGHRLSSLDECEVGE